MIALFFVACLKTLPTACEEHILPNVDDVSHMACMIQAQPQLAVWAELHPRYTVVHWSCRPENTRQFPI